MGILNHVYNSGQIGIIADLVGLHNQLTALHHGSGKNLISFLLVGWNILTGEG